MGLFSSLFGAKKNAEPIDMNGVLVDMHSHLIPGIDDGSKTMQETIELIRNFKELGYQKLITTPHIMSDFYKNTPEIITSGLEKVRAELERQNIKMPIEAAAEYYIDYEFIDKVQKQKLLTFGDGFILVEISYLNEPDGLDSVIFELQTSGYKVILAHPERYPFWYNNFERYSSLKDKDIFFQININSLAGHYSPGAKAIAEKLITHNMVDFIGSDCHHANHMGMMQRTLSNASLHHLLASGKLKNHLLL